MIRRLIAIFAVAGLVLQGSAALAAAEFKIVTAFERGTYIEIGRNLSDLIAPQADISLEVMPSAGSGENVRRLRYEHGVKLAIVQSDVFQAFLDQAANGNASARDMIRPLRVVMPLYDTEMYFIVRQDSPMNYIHDIRGARINASELGSGTALSAATLYRMMFGTPIPEANVSYLSNEEGLVKLTTDKSVDVVAVNAGQPAKILVDMKPEARKLIKLLKFDPTHPASQEALKIYSTGTVHASIYPNLLTEDVPARAVKAYLVTYDYNLKPIEIYLRRFARSLCENFSTLQEKGHPKWREVDLALPELSRGWLYYAPTAYELRACIAGKSARNTWPRTTPVASDCSQQAQILGLCRGR